METAGLSGLPVVSLGGVSVEASPASKAGPGPEPSTTSASVGAPALDNGAAGPAASAPPLDPTYIPPILRKVEDYIEPRVGSEYQATLLPTPQFEALPRGNGGHSLLYSRAAAKRAEEAAGIGHQHDVLLDEFGVYLSQKRRATRGSRIEARPLGPGAEIVLAAYAGTRYDATAVRAALAPALVWAEANETDPAGGPGPRAAAWDALLASGQEYGLRPQKELRIRKTWLEQLARAYAAPDALRQGAAGLATIPPPFASSTAFGMQTMSPFAVPVPTSSAPGDGDVAMANIPGAGTGVGVGEAQEPLVALSDLRPACDLLLSIGGSVASVLPPMAAAYVCTQFRIAKVEPVVGEVVTSHYVERVAEGCAAFAAAAALAVKASTSSLASTLAGPGTRRRSAVHAVDPAAALASIAAALPMPAPQPASRVSLCRERAWSDTEVLSFAVSFARHGKNFAFISRGVRSKSTQLCVGFYYTGFRRTDQWVDYQRFRQTLGPDGKLDRFINRRDRAWFHYWRFDEDALGPALPPPVVPVPELMRMKPAGEMDKARAADAIVPYMRGGPGACALDSGWALPLLSPGIDVIVLPSGEAVAAPPPRQPGSAAPPAPPPPAPAGGTVGSSSSAGGSASAAVLVGGTAVVSALWPAAGTAAGPSTVVLSAEAAALGVHAGIAPIGMDEGVRALRSTMAKAALLPVSAPVHHHMGDPMAHKDPNAALSREQLIHHLAGQSHVDPLGDYRKVLAHAGRALREAAAAAGIVRDGVPVTPPLAEVEPASGHHTRASMALPGGARAHMFSDSWVDDRPIDNESYCGICGDGGDMICCEGPCRRSFHTNCLRGADQTIKAAIKASPALQKHRWYGHLFDYDREDWKCYGCISGIRDCFVCGSTGVEGVDIFRCLHMCGKFYHLSCLQRYPGTRFYKANLHGHDIDPSLGPIPLNFLSSNGEGVGSGHVASVGEGGHLQGDGKATLEGPVRIGFAASDGVGGMKIQVDASCPTLSAEVSGPLSASAALDELCLAPADIVSAATVALRVRQAVEERTRGAGGRGSALTLTLHVPSGTSPRFSCPLHQCASCQEPFHPFQPPQYFRCHACPSAFHAPCVPNTAQRDMNEIVTCPDMAAHNAKRMSALYKERSGVSRVRQPEDAEAVAEAARMRREQLAKDISAGKMRIGDSALFKLSAQTGGGGSLSAADKAAYASGVWMAGGAAALPDEAMVGVHRSGPTPLPQIDDSEAVPAANVWGNDPRPSSSARAGGGGAGHGGAIPAKPVKKVRISLRAAVHTPNSSQTYRGGANAGALSPDVRGSDAIALALARGARMAHIDVLDEAWYAEIRRRTDALVAKGLGKRGLTIAAAPPNREKVTGIKFMASLRVRQWVTRIALNEVPRRDVMLGGYDDPLEAAVAFDYGSTYFRGTSAIEHNLNYPRSPSDCRLMPPIDPWPGTVLAAAGSSSAKIRLPKWVPLFGEASVPVLTKQQIISALERGSWEEPPEDEADTPSAPGGTGVELEALEEAAPGPGGAGGAGGAGSRFPSRSRGGRAAGLEDLFGQVGAGVGGVDGVTEDDSWRGLASLVDGARSGRARIKHTRSHFETEGEGGGGGPGEFLDDEEDGEGEEGEVPSKKARKKAAQGGAGAGVWAPGGSRGSSSHPGGAQGGVAFKSARPALPVFVPPRSTFIGVFPDKGWGSGSERWWARLTEGGVNIKSSSSWFSTEAEAGSVYDRMALSRRGAKAMTNYHFTVGKGLGAAGQLVDILTSPSSDAPTPIAIDVDAGPDAEVGTDAAAAQARATQEGEQVAQVTGSGTGGAGVSHEPALGAAGVLASTVEGASTSTGVVDASGQSTPGGALSPGHEKHERGDKSDGIELHTHLRARLNLKTGTGAITILITREGGMSLMEASKRSLRALGIDPEGSTWQAIESAYRGLERKRADEQWTAIETAKAVATAEHAAAKAQALAATLAAATRRPALTGPGPSPSHGPHTVGAPSGLVPAGSAHASVGVPPGALGRVQAYLTDEEIKKRRTRKPAEGDMSRLEECWMTLRAAGVPDAHTITPFAGAQLISRHPSSGQAVDSGGGPKPSTLCGGGGGVQAQGAAAGVAMLDAYADGTLLLDLTAAIDPAIAQSAAGRRWIGPSNKGQGQQETLETCLLKLCSTLTGLHGPVHALILPFVKSYVAALPPALAREAVSRRDVLGAGCVVDASVAGPGILRRLVELRASLGTSGCRTSRPPSLSAYAGLPLDVHEEGATGLAWFLEGVERAVRVKAGASLPSWASAAREPNIAGSHIPASAPRLSVSLPEGGARARPTSFYAAARNFVNATSLLWLPETCTLFAVGPEPERELILPGLLCPCSTMLSPGTIFRDSEGRVLDQPLGVRTQFAHASYTHPGRYALWDGQYSEQRISGATDASGAVINKLYSMFRPLLTQRLARLKALLAAKTDPPSAETMRNFDGLRVLRAGSAPAGSLSYELGVTYPLPTPAPPTAHSAYVDLPSDHVQVRMVTLREADKVHKSLMGYDAPHPAQVLLTAQMATAISEAVGIQAALRRLRAAFSLLRSGVERGELGPHSASDKARQVTGVTPEQLALARSSTTSSSPAVSAVGAGRAVGRAGDSYEEAFPGGSVEGAARFDMSVISERLFVLSPELFGVAPNTRISYADGFAEGKERVYCVCRHTVCNRASEGLSPSNICVPLLDASGAIVAPPPPAGRIMVLEPYAIRHEGNSTLHKACPRTGPDACKMCAWIQSMGPEYMPNQRGSDYRKRLNANEGTVGAATGSPTAAGSATTPSHAAPSQPTGLGLPHSYPVPVARQYVFPPALLDLAGSGALWQGKGSVGEGRGARKALILPATLPSPDATLPFDPYLCVAAWERFLSRVRIVEQACADTRGSRHDDDVLVACAGSWLRPTLVHPLLLPDAKRCSPELDTEGGAPRVTAMPPCTPYVATGPFAWRFTVAPRPDALPEFEKPPASSQAGWSPLTSRQAPREEGIRAVDTPLPLHDDTANVISLDRICRGHGAAHLCSRVVQARGGDMSALHLHLPTIGDRPIAPFSGAGGGRKVDSQSQRGTATAKTVSGSPGERPLSGPGSGRGRKRKQPVQDGEGEPGEGRDGTGEGEGGEHGKREDSHAAAQADVREGAAAAPPPKKRGRKPKVRPEQDATGAAGSARDIPVPSHAKTEVLMEDSEEEGQHDG